MTRTPPSYIPQAIIGAALDFPWEGSAAHRGPGQVVTKLLDRLSSTTTCGQLIMQVGIVEWCAWRLKGHVSIENALHFCDAGFAYQVDTRYADRDAIARGKEPEGPPEVAALFAITGWLFKSMNPRWMTSYFQPIPETFHAATLVRHILPKAHKKDFSTWLDGLAGRVRARAPKPDEEQKKKREFDSPEAHKAYLARHWGAALPLEILDPEADSEADPEALIAARLAALDWQANPFLRSPEAMAKLGFEGTPYALT